MAYTNDLTTEISLYDNTLSNNRAVNVSELKENSQLPNDFDIKSFCDEINKVWNSYGDLSFVDKENPLAILNGDNFNFNGHIWENWENNDEILAFILGGDKLNDSRLDWDLNLQKDKKEYKRVTSLANELLKILKKYEGENDWMDRINFYWQVIGDEGYENYRVSLKYNPEQINFPIVEIFSDFYEENANFPLKKNILATNAFIHDELRELLNKKNNY